MTDEAVIHQSSVMSVMFIGVIGVTLTVWLGVSALTPQLDPRDVLFSISRDTRPRNGVFFHDTRAAAFNDPNVENAVRYLGAYPHPWTVEKLIIWFREASTKSNRDGHAEEALLWILAATRDPRAAVVLGEILENKQPSQAAYESLLVYFPSEDKTSRGGSQDRFLAARRWWRENRHRYEHLEEGPSK